MKYDYGQREACTHCGHDIEFSGKDGWRDRGGGRTCLTHLDRNTGEFVHPTTDHAPPTATHSERKKPTDYDLYDPQHKPLLDALLRVQQRFPAVTKVMVCAPDSKGQRVSYLGADDLLVFEGMHQWPSSSPEDFDVLTTGAKHALDFLKGAAGVFHMIPPKTPVPHDKPAAELLPGEKVVKAGQSEARGTKAANPLVAAKAFAKDFFDACSKAFASDPGGDNWRRLRYAMWTLQAASSLHGQHVADLVKAWPAQGDATDEQYAEAIVRAVNGQGLEALRKEEALYDLDRSE